MQAIESMLEIAACLIWRQGTSMCGDDKPRTAEGSRGMVRRQGGMMDSLHDATMCVIE